MTPVFIVLILGMGSPARSSQGIFYGYRFVKLFQFITANHLGQALAQSYKYYKTDVLSCLSRLLMSKQPTLDL